MVSIRGIHWGILLGEGLDLMESLLMSGRAVRSLEFLSHVLLMVSQIGILLVILGKIHWGEYLVKLLDLIETLLVVYHMVVATVRIPSRDLEPNL